MCKREYDWNTMQIQCLSPNCNNKHADIKNGNPLPPVEVTPVSDKVNFSHKLSQNNDILFHKRGNVTHVVTFQGLKNPVKELMPALQMKVKGVSNYQKSFSELMPGEEIGNINKIAQSEWKDEEPLDFVINNNRILLAHPKFGAIGRVPEEIAANLLHIIRKDPSNYSFGLSNLVAGNSKGAETIGLRVNLLYKGNNPENLKIVQGTFNDILNNKECAEKIMQYQPKTSLEDTLKIILDYEEKTNGKAAAQKMSAVIDNISNEIKNPANKRILLIGHSKPDGDTIGSCLGLKNAIDLLGQDKIVDCAIDDKIPGLFRHKLPGLDGNIKMPQGSEYIKNLQKEIEILKKSEKTESTKNSINLLENEVKELQDPEKLLEKDSKYDLVILLDIPTPNRFTTGFKPYIESAKNVIYIDHHPHRFNEWQASKDKTGINMQQIQDRNLSLVAEAVPSATELVAVIAGKILPGLSDISAQGKKLPIFIKTQEQINKLNAFVASIVTGTSTDTSAFTRTANLLPGHATMAVQDRPNFMPEGVSKWLMDITDGKISKKWMRDNLEYDISDTKTDKLSLSARELMISHSIKGKNTYEDLSLGVVSMDYNKLNEIWNAGVVHDPELGLLDLYKIINGNEVMGLLKSNPELSIKYSYGNADPNTVSSKLAKLSKETYIGKYDNDRVAVFICQDKKKGELDEKLLPAESNGLRLSMRSGPASDHSEILASLFGGGGHGGASGGRIDLPGIELDSKLSVMVNGKIEKDQAKILAELKNNLKITHDHKIPDSEKINLTSKVEVIMDEQGSTCEDLIVSLTKEIRKDSIPYESKKMSKGKTDINRNQKTIIKKKR